MRAIKLFEVEFNSSTEFIQNNLRSGDYFIPLVSNLSYPNQNVQEGPGYEMQYDPNLLQVFQRQENFLAMNNVKMIGDPNRKGLIGFIDNIEYIDSRLSTNKFYDFVVNKIVSMYDSYITTRNLTYFWVPVWNTNSKIAKMLVLFDRIIFIFS